MKNLILLFCLCPALVFAQKKTGNAKMPVINETITKANLAKLKTAEDSLQILSDAFLNDSLANNRKKACYAFIPKLVKALEVDNSFFYPFDSVAAISQLYPPDSSFRILSWQLFTSIPVHIPAQYSKTHRDTTFYKPVARYYGVIQMRSKSIKIFPLFDAGDTLSYGSQQVLGNNNWWGQLYYNIIEKQVKGKNYYTLFGYEIADLLTNRKIIDILSFDAKGKPEFGAPMFFVTQQDDSGMVYKTDTLTRFFIEYNRQASTTLNYDSSLEMIVFDHVAPPNDKSKGATFSYIPDGTYEGFKWMNSHWQWVEKVFTFAINENDNPPVPVPKFAPPQKQPELPK